MQFITSKDRPADGAGKLIASEETDSIVEYFIAPGEPIERKTVATNSLEVFSPELQERIYFEDGHIWRIGRFDGFRDPDDPTQLDLILPNADNTTIHSDDAYIRSSIPLENPLPLLQSRNTETPFWHDRRAAFLRELHEQRSLYRGLTALASSNVEIVQHQLTVVRKVLNDPITRYLLADEVGLGKTIEAGIIIRQYVLDHPERARIRILVPVHLVAQWIQELLRLFRIASSTVDLDILSHDAALTLETDDAAHTLLVVDEAHLLAQHAYAVGTQKGNLYRHVQKHSTQANAVLLLSGTPIVHNEDTFLAMLHLLDPDAHPLTDRAGFRERIANREVIANALQDLTDDAGPSIIEPTLDDLRPLAESSELLRQRIHAVTSFLRSSDDGKRTQAISKLRAYLHSTYRLDRRILRTRRRRDHVKVHLGERRCTPWLIEDADRAKIYEWLDGWRLNAPSNAECAKVFSTMLTAAMRHPSLLKEVINRRLDNLDRGRQSHFDGEKDYLDRARFTTDIAHDVRLKTLVEILVAHRYEKQYLVFVSDRSIATEVTAYLRLSSLNVLHLGSGEDPLDMIKDFLTNQTYSALICDEESETGLNIQLPGTKVTAIHFDMPLFANQIEQRIGRLDRIHGHPIVESLVPLWPTDSHGTNYEHAWTKCLIEAVGVFDQSVATLQHALDAGHKQLTKHILVDGIEAIDQLAKMWTDANHPDSLIVELQKIESQELIDELVAQTDHEVFHQKVEDYEYDDNRIEHFQKSVREWARDCLGFKQRTCPTNDATCQGAVAYEYYNFRTLLPRSQVAHGFPSLRLQSRLFRDINTGWMHFDRDDAAKLRQPLARVGHPFITDLQSQITHDDRGRVFAYWKTTHVRPDHALHEMPELYFRFDFLVESDPAPFETLITSQQLSLSALRRRGDSVFPPRFITKWVDVEGREVRDDAYIRELSKPYGPQDTNLHEHHWTDIDRLTLIADWDVVCTTAYQTATQLIGNDPELRRETAFAHTTLATQFRETRDELLARIESTPQNDSDAARLTLETNVYEALDNALAAPRVRLDAVGAIFLAAKPLAEYLPDDDL
jgi:ATP-dependent helicase HepA